MSNDDADNDDADNEDGEDSSRNSDLYMPTV